MKNTFRLFAALSVVAALLSFGLGCADELAEESCSECTGDLQTACEDAIADCIRDDDLTTAECTDIGEALCTAQPVQ